MEQKVILITGASSGMGYHAARMLVQKGHRVYGAARRVDKLSELEQYGVVPLHMDITREEDISRAVESIIVKEQRIDILINNAGYGYFGAIEDVSIEDAKHQFEVNIFGLARLTQLVLPYMRCQRSGRIINTASIAGHVTFLFGAWYNATKYALEAFSDALRMEVKPFGIDVVIIEPGAIGTDWGHIAAEHLKESSQGGAYQQDAMRVAQALDRMYNSSLLTKPEKISRIMVNAALTRCPRPRYLVGLGAKPMRLLHAVLPTRLWDLIVRHYMLKL
ncbi:MAG TPA: short-chain dehydrogenase/reductase [Bacteroidales bacterium]|nr:short-chain dehydrogenase/reductase [Bacteroidales bacterium]